VQKFMHIFFQTEFASLLHSSCYIIMWPSIQQSPNDEANIIVLTFFYYSVLPHVLV
jgi:hypothetical protein